jgi:OPA family sugar phosphate sensor protein UhpC-like MFS transporter
VEKGKVAEPEQELSVRDILFKYVLTNRAIWVLSAAYFFVYLVRQAVNDWSFLYLTTWCGYAETTASFCVGVFEIGGLFGSLAAGWLSDLVFKGRRGPVNVLFSLGIVGAVMAFWSASSGHWIGAFLAMFAVGFFVFGPQMLIGIAAAELSHKKASATATGFAGFIAYAGAATAGAPIASIAQGWGWDAFFGTLAACGAATVVVLLPLWSKVQVKQLEAAEPVEGETA